jgi:hypothetical protein
MKIKFEIRRKKDVSKEFLDFIHSILMFVFSTYTSNCPKLTPSYPPPDRGTSKLVASIEWSNDVMPYNSSFRFEPELSS